MATTKKSVAPKKAGAAAKKSSPQKAAAVSAVAKKAAPVSTAQPAKKSAASKAAAPKDSVGSSTAKKAAAQKASASKAAAPKASATTASASKAAAKKAPDKKASAPKVTVKNPPEKAASAKTASDKKAAAKVTPGKGAAGKSSGKTTPKVAEKLPAEDSSAASTQSDQKPPVAPSPNSVKKTNGSSGRSGPEVFEIPAPRGTSKDGIAYTKDFDVKFLKAQWDMLLEERARLLGQAVRLEDEAHQLIEEAEMGDVQFDDEGGEGDTMVVERERDLALSAQARETITEIDAAIERIKIGTYGYSTTSGRPIPRERLEAIPWATELVSEKVGGIGRR
jgi:RNA polymerase-binding transcription factor DksA